MSARLLLICLAAALPVLGRADDLKTVDFRNSATKADLTKAGVVLQPAGAGSNASILPQHIKFLLPEGRVLEFQRLAGALWMEPDGESIWRITTFDSDLSLDDARKIITAYNQQYGFSQEELDAWLKLKMWRSTQHFFKEFQEGRPTFAFTLRADPRVNDDAKQQFTISATIAWR